MNTIVIAYGNRLRSDDGIGWHIVEALQQLEMPLQCELQFHHQLTPELADTIRNFRKVIFVDASVGENPGEVSCKPIYIEYANSSLHHHLTPGGLLHLSQIAFEITPMAYLVTIVGKDFSYGEQLSDIVVQSIPKALDQIIRLVQEPPDPIKS